MNWYLAVLKKYAEFDGRAHRTEYWMFYLVNLIVCVLFGVLGGISHSLNILGGIYVLAILVPGIAVGVRRLHDTGRSGWWLLIGLVPLIGGIWLLILTVLDSQPGDNEYGPNPKGM